jgi:hypothetical protein
VDLRSGRHEMDHSGETGDVELPQQSGGGDVHGVTERLTQRERVRRPAAHAHPHRELALRVLQRSLPPGVSPWPGQAVYRRRVPRPRTALPVSALSVPLALRPPYGHQPLQNGHGESQRGHSRAAGPSPVLPNTQAQVPLVLRTKRVCPSSLDCDVPHGIGFPCMQPEFLSISLSVTCAGRERVQRNHSHCVAR